MIHFNESRVSLDGKKLIIDVSVDDQIYFDDIYISSIIIDTEDSFLDFGPSGNPVYSWVEEDPVMVGGVPVYKRHVRLELDVNDVNISSLQGHMFYVYVRTSGDLAPNTPCEYKQDLFMRVVFDYGPIYRENMRHIKKLGEHCEVQDEFIDRILKINALELSIIAGHYSLANSYWNKFFKNQKNGLRPKKCGCDG